MNVQGGSVENKVKKATEYLLEAGALFGSMSTDEVLRSELHLHAMERYFQLIVDAVLDINGHLIKELDLEPAEDLKGTFEIPSDSDVLKKDFSEKISRVVGLRSLIVHQYEKVDNRKFLEDFRENNGDFDEHFLAILVFLEKKHTHVNPRGLHFVDYFRFSFLRGFRVGLKSFSTSPLLYRSEYWYNSPPR